MESKIDWFVFDDKNEQKINNFIENYYGNEYERAYVRGTLSKLYRQSIVKMFSPENLSIKIENSGCNR